MDEMARLKQLALKLTAELVSSCRFCVDIADDPDDSTPISCIKYSGCPVPVRVNAEACLSCREYEVRKSPNGPSESA